MEDWGNICCYNRARKFRERKRVYMSAKSAANRGHKSLDIRATTSREEGSGNTIQAHNSLSLSLILEFYLRSLWTRPQGIPWTWELRRMNTFVLHLSWVQMKHITKGTRKRCRTWKHYDKIKLSQKTLPPPHVFIKFNFSNLLYFPYKLFIVIFFFLIKSKLKFWTRNHWLFWSS